MQPSLQSNDASHMKSLQSTDRRWQAYVFYTLAHCVTRAPRGKCWREESTSATATWTMDAPQGKCFGRRGSYPRRPEYPQAKGMRHSLRNPMYILSDICRILMSGGIRIPPLRSAVYSETVTIHPQDGSENIIIPAIPLGTPCIYQVIYAGF